MQISTRWVVEQAGAGVALQANAGEFDTRLVPSMCAAFSTESILWTTCALLWKASPHDAHVARVAAITPCFAARCRVDAELKAKVDQTIPKRTRNRIGKTNAASATCDPDSRTLAFAVRAASLLIASLLAVIVNRCPFLIEFLVQILRHRVSVNVCDSGPH